MILVVQGKPPSKLTPANMPAAGTTTLVTITMLFGLVGLTAMASSDSLVERWLTAMFVGVGCAPARTGKTSRATANPSDFIEASDSTGRVTKWGSRRLLESRYRIS